MAFVVRCAVVTIASPPQLRTVKARLAPYTRINTSGRLLGTLTVFNPDTPTLEDDGYTERG
jgi:hypothetical protein